METGFADCNSAIFSFLFRFSIASEIWHFPFKDLKQNPLKSRSAFVIKFFGIRYANHGSFSSNFGKCELSVWFFKIGMYSGCIFRKFCQSKPLKNGWLLISLTPFLPIRLYLSLISLEIKSTAFLESLGSVGNLRFYFQLTTLAQVSSIELP